MPLTFWGTPAPSPATNPAIPPVRLLIVAQPGHAQAFYAAFAADARFAVQAVATSADDARAKLTLEPEAVIVEVVVFSGPPEFANSAVRENRQAVRFDSCQLLCMSGGINGDLVEIEQKCYNASH